MPTRLTPGQDLLQAAKAAMHLSNRALAGGVLRMASWHTCIPPSCPVAFGSPARLHSMHLIAPAMLGGIKSLVGGDEQRGTGGVG